jgi:hypothetical protein
MDRPPPAADSQRGDRADAVAALTAAVARAGETLPAPPRPLSADAVAAYVGDASAIVSGGSRAEQIALLARLTALADAAAGAAPGTGEPARAGVPERLARTLRRWERLRRAGTAGPRPTAAQLRERLALLGAAGEPGGEPGEEPGADVVAIAVAELVAQELLAGPVSVERGLRAVQELGPCAQRGAARLSVPPDGLASGLPARPGAALAHVDHVIWQLTSMRSAGLVREDLPIAERLWSELAAVLVVVHDAHAGRTSHHASWSAALAIAVDLLTLGDLADVPEAHDWAAALERVRSAALRFAAAWLDEASGAEARPSAAAGRERVLEAAAEALLGAWSAARRAG